MEVTDTHPGLDFYLNTDISGGVLSGPIGKVVARVLRSDVRKSVETWPQCTDSAFTHRVGWPANRSRSAWRIRRRSIPSQSRPAPNAISPTIAAATPPST